MTDTVNDSAPGVNSDMPEAVVQLRGLILGYVVSRAVHVAAELDLANHLRDGNEDSAALAARCGAHAQTLSRLMRMLVTVGVFAERNGRFMNNELSGLLRSDVPNSMRALARMSGADFRWSVVQALMHSVQTGEPAFQHIFKEEIFSYLSHHPDEAQLFDEAMVNGSDLMNHAIVDAYDFSEFTVLVDIAGG